MEKEYNELADEALELLESYEEQGKLISEQEIKLLEQAPKVEFFDTVADSDDAIEIGVAAKLLKLGVGRNGLFEFLRNEKILMSNNVPYQRYIDKGYFRIVQQTFLKPEGSVHVNIKTLVYQTGLDFIKKLYKQ
jgi:phage antirepressor YoqD-like protein